MGSASGMAYALTDGRRDVSKMLMYYCLPFKSINKDQLSWSSVPHPTVERNANPLTCSPSENVVGVKTGDF